MLISMQLDAALRNTIPSSSFDGVSIGINDDKSTWRVDFTASATAQHRAEAAELISEFEPAPEVSIAAPHLNGGALARFSGSAPIVIYENIGLSGVVRVSKGRYRVYHEAAMPSDSYSAFPSILDASPRTYRITARTTAYVEIRTTDLAGVVQDPTEVTVEIKRVVTPS